MNDIPEKASIWEAKSFWYDKIVNQIPFSIKHAFEIRNRCPGVSG